MKNKTLSILIVCGVLFFIANCNIFDWTTSTEDEAFYDGLKLFNQNKFTEAKEKFAEAMEADPNRSDYCYYHAKATVLESEINFFALAREIIDVGESDSLYLPLYSRVPEKDPGQDDQQKNHLYGVTIVAHDDIIPIYKNETHGEIKPDDIYFEFSLLAYARALLQLRDTNNDGQIDNDDFYFSIERQTIGDSTVYVINGLDNPDFYFYLTSNYQTFNSVLANSLRFVGEGSISLYLASGDTTLFDNEDLTQIMETVENTGSYFMVNDGIDNDGDGEIDEELLNGINDDPHNDDLIDEDTRLF